MDVPLPRDLDLGATWTVRVTAVDATGATVAGVKAGPVKLIVSALGTGSLEFGAFMLVPGPGA